MSSIFPTTFLNAIDRLTLAIGDAPRNPHAGAHLGRQAGNSLEFRDYQPYSAGDDLRRVDWNLYARTRELVVRQFERPTAVPVYAFVDNSASMHAESPPRYATAARVAAAIASAAVTGGSPAHVLISTADSIHAPRAASDRRGLSDLLAELDRDRAPGAGPAASIAAAVRTIAGRPPGVFVAATDAFESAGVDALIDALRRVPHRLVVVQITQPWDAEPQINGAARVQDSESTDAIDVRVDAAMLARYRASYERYFTAFDAGIVGRGGRRFMLDASADTVPQLERLFRAGKLSV